MAIQRVSASTSALDAGSSDSVGVAMGTNPTTGNLLECRVRWKNAGVTLTGVTDGQGNTWSIATQQNLTGANVQVGIAYAMNVTGGASRVSAAFSGAAVDREIYVGEWSSVATSSALGQVLAREYNASAIAVSPGTMTTTTDGELIVCCETNGTDTQPAAAGNFTLRDYQSLGGPNFSSIDQVQASAGAISAWYTAPTPTAFATVAVSFKAVGAVASASSTIAIRPLRIRPVQVQ